MTFALGWYSDAGLTAPITPYLTVDQLDDGSDGPVDVAIYLGSTLADKEYVAASNPGTDQMTVSVSYATATWAPSTAYAVGNYVRPLTPNAKKYRCSVAGTTGTTEPTWGTTNGGTTVSGTATFVCEPIHQPAEIKLALTQSGLDGATGGASINIGTQLLSGIPNALQVWTRIEDATAFEGATVDLQLVTSNIRQRAQ